MRVAHAGCEGCVCWLCVGSVPLIRSAKQDDIYGASNIVLPCPCSQVIFHLVKDVDIILKYLIYSPSNMYLYHLPVSPKVTLFCPIIHPVMTQYQLLLSQKITSLCPIICLIMIKNRLLLSKKTSNSVPKFVAI